MRTHGLRSTYADGCRCTQCRAAATAYAADARAERRARGERDPSLIPHGTYGGYNNWLCRCQPCTDAHLARMRAYKRLRRHPAGR